MNREKKVRLICWIICEVLAVGTAIHLLSGGMNEGLLLAFATPFMLLLPTIAEKLFRCKVSLPIFIFGLVYAMGPMLGQCWKLYYLTNWWDKALHISGGVMFALVGWFVCQKLKDAFLQEKLFRKLWKWLQMHCVWYCTTKRRVEKLFRLEEYPL